MSAFTCASRSIRTSSAHRPARVPSQRSYDVRNRHPPRCARSNRSRGVNHHHDERPRQPKRPSHHASVTEPSYACGSTRTLSSCRRSNARHRRLPSPASRARRAATKPYATACALERTGRTDIHDRVSVVHRTTTASTPVRDSPHARFPYAHDSAPRLQSRIESSDNSELGIMRGALAGPTPPHTHGSSRAA